VAGEGGGGGGGGGGGVEESGGAGGTSVCLAVSLLDSALQVDGQVGQSAVEQNLICPHELLKHLYTPSASYTGAAATLKYGGCAPIVVV
jgi:hypothetical protein